MTPLFTYYFILQAYFPDADIDEAFVAGWGTLTDKFCTTIDKGPSKAGITDL